MNRKKAGSVSRRSGTIELLRFLFCVAVVLFHANKYFLDDVLCNETILEPLRQTLCTHGAIGVEFFFIVSGYLMAKNANKRYLNDQKLQRIPDIAGDTVQFLWGKIKAILPYHIPAFVVASISWIWLQQMDALRSLIYVVSSLPSFFLVHMSGIGGGRPNHVEWYVSVMLLAMLLLYPLMRKNYRIFSHVIAPILALFLLGWVSETAGRVTGVTAWTGICYRSILRGIAELCFGVMTFEIVKALDSVKLHWLVRLLLTALELVCVAGITWFILCPFPDEYEITAIVLIFGLVIVAFSRQNLLRYVLDNPISYFLGKLSLPIYLSQVACINYIQMIAQTKELLPTEQVWLCVEYTAGLALVTMIVGDVLAWLLFGSKRRRRRASAKRVAERVEQPSSANTIDLQSGE